jgi:hypothetical protein
MAGSAGLGGRWCVAIGVRRACRGKDDGARHLRPGRMEGPGCFSQRGSGGQDVVDDDAGVSGDLVPGPPADPHGTAHPLCPGTTAKAFLPAGQLQARPACFREDICNTQPRQPSWRAAEEHMNGAEAPVQVRSGAGGDRDQEEFSCPFRSGADRAAQRASQASFELVLTMPFEGEQRLGKFFPVYAGGNHRKEHRPRHVHKRRGCALGTERGRGEPPDVAVAPDAERPVFRAAAHAVHRNCQGKQISRRVRELVQDAQDPAAVVRTVPGAVSGRRGQVRVQPQRWPGVVPQSCSGSHSLTVHREAAPGQHPSALCGQRPVRKGPRRFPDMVVSLERMDP